MERFRRRYSQQQKAKGAGTKKEGAAAPDVSPDASTEDVGADTEQ